MERASERLGINLSAILVLVLLITRFSLFTTFPAFLPICRLFRAPCCNRRIVRSQRSGTAFLEISGRSAAVPFSILELNDGENC